MPDPGRIVASQSIVGRRRASIHRVGVGLLVLSALALAGTAGGYLTSRSTQVWFADGGWTAAALVAVVGAAARTCRSAPRERVGWALLLTSGVAWLGGQVVWDVYSATSFSPSPNPADILWLGSALAGASGMYWLCRGVSRSLKVSLLEVAPLIVAVIALVVALLLGDLRTSRLSGVGQATSLAYPMLYVSGTLVVFQAVIGGGVDLRHNRGIAAVLVGLVLNATAFILWSPQLLAGTYVAGTGVIDAMWTVGMVLLGVGAWAARPIVTLAGAEAIADRRRGVLPALTFLLLAGVEIALNAESGGVHLALTVGIWIVGVTLISHGSVMRRRQTTLLAQLHARERELNEANILLGDANRVLSHESRRDALTGLRNRLCLQEDLAELAARGRRDGQGYAVVLFDVDHFKAYNDDQGHQAGDRVLVQIGELLNKTVRQEERAYRYGGEELLLVLGDHDQEAGRTVAERYRRQLQHAALPHPLNPPSRVVTISAGVAAVHPGDTPGQVLHRADTALYKAKTLGRNRIVVADPETALSRPAALTPVHT